MAKTAKRFYAVARGKVPGIYNTWFGPGGAHEQVDSYPGAVYKGFASRDEALQFLGTSTAGNPDRKAQGKRRVKSAARDHSLPEREVASGHDVDVTIYADGGCINNPGPGGYGVVVIDGKGRRELSGGFRLTTNNRMELMAVIQGLESLGKDFKGSVRIMSDSRYVVNGISKGWAVKWRKNGWMRDSRSPAENMDLWSLLLGLCERLKPGFTWVKGHAGIEENERCDILAGEAAENPGLPPDVAYEKRETTIRPPSLF